MTVFARESGAVVKRSIALVFPDLETAERADTEIAAFVRQLLASNPGAHRLADERRLDNAAKRSHRR